MKRTSWSPAAWGLASVWGVAEAGLGGVMHGLKLPFTGLTVGGIAVAALIALAAHERGLYEGANGTGSRSTARLLEVTATVLLIKALASPHSPFTAYIAVAFQGGLAALLFRIVPSFSFAATAFAALAMAESATQKLLMLVLVYGHAFVDALDALSGYASGQIAATGLHLPLSSRTLLAIFLGVYVLWGLVLGWTVSRWPGRSQRLRDGLVADWEGAQVLAMGGGKRRRRGGRFTLLALLAAVLAAAGASWGELGRLVVRTVAITAVLLGVVGPAVRWAVERRAGAARRGLALQLMATFDEQRRRFQWAFQRARRLHPAWRVPLVGLEHWILLNLIHPPGAD